MTASRRTRSTHGDIHSGAPENPSPFAFDAPSPEFVEALADALAPKVAALLAGGVGHGGGQSALVDVAEIARRFGLSRGYVYEHADELGAVRIGDGPRARLRFDVAEVAERLTAGEGSKRPVGSATRSAKPKPTARRRRLSGADAPLIPIRKPGRPR
ncbi:MAG TPA: hypothetical protein VIJ21_05820 [Solirubrobacterales bacterium]